MASEVNHFYSIGDWANQFCIFDRQDGLVNRVLETTDINHVSGVFCDLVKGHPMKPYYDARVSVEIKTGELQNLNVTQYRKLLVDDSTRRILEDHEISGLEFAEPMVSRSSANGAPRLHYLRVRGWAGIASEKSGINFDRVPCASCGTVAYPWPSIGEEIVDRSQWDGSDVFRVWPLSRYTFVTPRFRDLIQRYKLDGVSFLEETEIYGRNPFLASRGVGPGALQDIMEPKIAMRRRAEMTKILEMRARRDS